MTFVLDLKKEKEKEKGTHDIYSTKKRQTSII